MSDPKRRLFDGAYGVVLIEHGKATKTPKEPFDYSLNREFIAYDRLKGGCGREGAAEKNRASVSSSIDSFVPRLLDYHVDRSIQRVKRLTYEDAGQDLYHWLQEGKLFDAVQNLLKPMLSALSWLHERGVVHGDLHYRNLCLRLVEDGRIAVKIVDFGASVILRSESRWRQDRRSGVLIDRVTGLPTDQNHLRSVAKGLAEKTTANETR